MKTNKNTTATKEYLIALLDGNNTIYTSVKSVSKSGMSRTMSFYISKHEEILDITWYVAEILGYKRLLNGSIRVTGCGMNMCFATVYSLSCALFCHDEYDHEAAYKLKHRDL